MYKYCLLLFAWVLLSYSAQSQDRYMGNFFDEILIETATYATKDGQNLEMDIYLPKNDSEQERALLIFVHGGGFSGGKRDLPKIQEFCENMASYGYVVASISYRLTRKGKPEGFGCNCPQTDKLNTFYAAVEDLQDATFFLIENRHQYQIDPQNIILAGSSAGAETVLNTAYQAPYCYGLDSGPVAIAGVISVAGAIPDTTVLYDESAVPSLFLHGTDDKLVPYATAPHHLCEEGKPGYMILHGPQTLAQKLDQLNTPYWLYTVCGMNHDLSSVPLSNYLDEILTFCYDYVITDNGEAKHTIVKGEQRNKQIPVYDFCSE